MKILAFMPLLVWMLGFLALGEWSDHLRAIDGRSQVDDPEEDSAQSGLWFFVSLFWFILGIALCA